MNASEHQELPSSAREDEVSLYLIFSVILESRRVIALAVTMAVFLSVGVTLLGKRTFTAEAVFMPQQADGRSSAGGLAALAGQFGVRIPQGEPAQSPQFYAELLKSRELLGRLLNNDLQLVSGSDTSKVGLPELLLIKEDDPAMRREETLRALADMISTSTTRETGMVRVVVVTESPQLSEAIADQLLVLVNEFNLETRQSRAAAESRFVRERLRDTQESLRQAEAELSRFLEGNRQFSNSPQLNFEHDRLQRRVLHQQQLFTGLQESLEAAQISQVRDTPVITVVGAPEAPVYPDPRGIVLRALLGGILGGMAGLFFSFIRLALANPRDGEDVEYQKLRKAWRETLADLRLARRTAA